MTNSQLSVKCRPGFAHAVECDKSEEQGEGVVLIAVPNSQQIERLSARRKGVLRNHIILPFEQYYMIPYFIEFWIRSGSM